MRWGLIGASTIAEQHMIGAIRATGGEVAAVVSTTAARARDYAAHHAIPAAGDNLSLILDDASIGAVYISSTNEKHQPQALAAIAAGKHVLCEKPLATSAADADQMADAAARAGVVNMVNLTYRNVPALQQAARMVADGALGRIRHFEASYLQSWLTQPAWGDWRTEPQWLWRLSTAHGSKGVLGDVGIHILDFATFIAGQDAAEVSARLATFDKAPGNRIGDYALDANDSATLQLRLTGGALGVVHATRLATGHLNDLRLRLYGDLGGLEVRFEKAVSHLRACLGEDIQTGTWTDVDCPPVPTIYQRFIAAIRGEGLAEPDFARGAALQRLLDRAEASAQEGGRLLQV